MRIRRRASAPAPEAALVADAGDQAAWDADRPRPRRRMLPVVAAPGLVALLILVALFVSRGGDEGDILALGSAPESSDLSPVEDFGLLTGGELGNDPSAVGPGESVPVVPAGGDPAAAAAAAAAPGAAAGATSASGTPPAPGAPGAAPSTGAGGVAVPTTSPGGGTSPTTAAPGTTAPLTTPTTPAPPCAITNASAMPNPVRRHRNDRLETVVTVSFRPTNCSGGSYRVQVNGLDLPATGTGGGFYAANLPTDRPRWDAGDHTITITGSGASTTLNLSVT